MLPTNQGPCIFCKSFFSENFKNCLLYNKGTLGLPERYQTYLKDKLFLLFCTIDCASAYKYNKNCTLLLCKNYNYNRTFLQKLI